MVEQQQQQQHSETRMYEPLKDSFDSIQLRLDPSPTLNIIKHSLLRESWNPKLEAWVNEHDLTPFLARAGVQDLMIELESRMSIDKVLGNINDKEYNLILREIGEVTLEFIYFKADIYDIKESDISRIYHIVLHNVRIFLSRARNGIENLYLSKQFEYKQQEVKHGDATFTTQPQQSSFLSSFGKPKIR